MRGILKVGALEVLRHSNLKIYGIFKNTWEVAQSSRLCTEADSEPCQTSKMELLANIVNGFRPSTIFAKTSPFDFLQGFWIYPYFKYKFFPINVQWPFQWLLPFSDLSHIVVIVKRFQNSFLYFQLWRNS